MGNGRLKGLVHALEFGKELNVCQCNGGLSGNNAQYALVVLGKGVYIGMGQIEHPPNLVALDEWQAQQRAHGGSQRFEGFEAFIGTDVG